MVCKVTPKISSCLHIVSGEQNGEQYVSAHATLSSNRSDQDARTQELVADYETALDSAGYGSFSLSALGACAFAFFTTGVENCVMSYVLPSARCELKLTTYQTGMINMAFMSGGTASAFFWGIVGDVFGMRTILSLTLLMNAAITLGQSTITDYRLLLAARTINGFLIGGPSTLVFTYLSDLVGEKRRQLYLSVVGMSFVGAWLILPASAWLLLPIKVGYPTILPIYSWRLYLAVASIPAFIAGFWVLYLPESPRLLSDTNRSDKALEILQQIYKKNHGSAEGFKIKKLIEAKTFVPKSVTGEESRTKTLFIAALKELRTFVSKKYAVKSTLIMFIFFANMAAGFGLNLWIPELLQRMQVRVCKYTPTQSLQLFNATNTTWREMTQEYSRNDLELANDSAFQKEGSCKDQIDDEVFTSGLIVGACCMVGNAMCAVLMARGGARGVRRAAAACALACGLACACLAACACACANSNKVAVAAAAMLTAASLNGNILLIRLLLHALPANLSALGVCWGAWWGRAGGVASNIAVGALLDFSCPAPFISVSALLAVSIGGIMMIKLEEAPQPVLEKEPEVTEKNTGLDKYISTHM